MAYVEVDVDMGDFAASDLVDEIIHRLHYCVGQRKELSAKQIRELKHELKEADGEPEELSLREIKVRNLDDLIKYEHLRKIWDKYTPDQFEKLLPY